MEKWKSLKELGLTVDKLTEEQRGRLRTRVGDSIKVLCTDARGIDNVVILCTPVDDVDRDFIMRVQSSGEYLASRHSSEDLGLIPRTTEGKTLWVNVYKYSPHHPKWGQFYTGISAYDTQAKSAEQAAVGKDYLGTFPVRLPGEEEY